MIGKIKSNKNYREKAIDQIIILNDRFLEEIKSKILARLFIAHIEEKIDFKTEEGESRDLERETILFSSGIAYLSSDWSNSLNISQIGKDLFNFGIK